MGNKKDRRGGLFCLESSGSAAIQCQRLAGSVWIHALELLDKVVGTVLDRGAGVAFDATCTVVARHQYEAVMSSTRILLPVEGACTNLLSPI